MPKNTATSETIAPALRITPPGAVSQNERPKPIRVASAANARTDHQSVRTGPGATTFTVIPCDASYSAQVRAMPIIPDFDDE